MGVCEGLSSASPSQDPTPGYPHWLPSGPAQPGQLAGLAPGKLSWLEGQALPEATF